MTAAPAGDRLHVVHVIATLTAGGAERQLEMLASRSAHPTTVVVLYGTGGIARGVRARGVEVVELDATGWRKLLLPLTLARLLRRLGQAGQADGVGLVHVHLLSAQVMGIPAARLARVPLVVSTEHSLMDTTIEGRPHTWWLRLLYRGLERLTHHTIAVSEVTARRLERWGVRRDRITVADLGVDLDAVAFEAADRAEVRAELGVTPETPVVVAVGRLDPVKRMDVALRSCAPLLREGAVLAVAGAGPLDGDLRALAADLGVADQVRWLGSRDRVGPVLSAADVLLSASADETFGMAVVEALGNGLPVVFAQCPAVESLPDALEQAHHVPASGDETTDAAALGRAVAARLASTAQRRWPVPPALVAAYGAQSAADRVDAVYARLRAPRGSRRG